MFRQMPRDAALRYGKAVAPFRDARHARCLCMTYEPLIRHRNYNTFHNRSTSNTSYHITIQDLAAMSGPPTAKLTPANNDSKPTTTQQPQKPAAQLEEDDEFEDFPLEG